MSGTAVGPRVQEYGIPTRNNGQAQAPRREFTSAPEVLRPALGNSYTIRQLRVFIQAARYSSPTEAYLAHGIQGSQ
ncbi:hypothetical protein K1Y78_42195 [Streptomyces sp. tea 10]|nr:hypothetical protein [Streptomyces sp. tea 10]